MNQKQANSAAWSCMSSVLAWVRGYLKPQDVFYKEQLEKWAEENGYTKKENPS